MDSYSNAALELHRAYGQVRERNRLELAAARVFDGKLAAKRHELKRFGKSGRLARQISVVAVMNAVNTEGRDVMKDDGYWKDQDRREFGIVDGARTVTAMKNRMGRVTYRKVYGSKGVWEFGKTTTPKGYDWPHTSMENKNVTIMVN